MTIEKSIPLLFIHGAGGTRSKWRYVQQQLSHPDATYVDLPGHGPDVGSPATSIEEFANMLGANIHEDCILVGHSMGGLIGIEVAAQNKHVKGLVLAASHFVLPVHEAILSKLADGVFPEGLFYSSYSKNAPAELLEAEKRELPLVSMATTLQDYACCNQYRNGFHTFSQLKIPALALYGGEDRLLPKTAKDELLHANPLARAAVIEDAGHYLMLERPQVFVSALTDFRYEVEKGGVAAD